ncbi:MAG: threonine--tRNA ligase [Planctomycetota bacterium]|nr:threonine--tRNA ligase [Planctomycetota bacterium]
MPRITLPDGTVREFDHPIAAAEVAAGIGPRLAKDALGARINGELCDLSSIITDDAELSIVTPTRRDSQPDPDALSLIRHSCAHVMAEAIQRLSPGVQLVYGPPLDTGFYYDLAVPEGRPLSTEDFEAIEEEMGKIIADDRPFARYELPNDEGMQKLKAEGSKYKIDNAKRAIEAGSQRLSWYVTGERGRDWEDLCRGPHVPSSGRIGAYKLLSLASSYWHGDAASDRLTRVYGTAFATPKQLQRHLQQLEEAKERDHRLLGKQLDLFHIDEAVGPGLILWTPNGAIIRRELEVFIQAELTKQGYQMVYTPHIGKLELYRTSGHFPYFRESQYPPMISVDQLQAFAAEGVSCAELANRMQRGDIEGYLLKPMNCPHHMKIFACRPRSYRDLPVRLAEFGTVYRWEQSGEIGGLTRVRGITQDDAHLFCAEEQIAEELHGCMELVKIIFSTLGMKHYRVRVGLRDPDGTKYVGDASAWDKAEQACRDAAPTLGVPFTEEAGEAAFYGPKIDFMVRDVIGREWQLGTIQVDYNLPQRFDLSYIGADNEPHRPVVIHRAPFGSMERFVGLLIEHFAGAFPTWLAPQQVRVLPISRKTLSYGKVVVAALVGQGVRATVDDSDDRIQAKIRVAAQMKIPYLLVVGPNDQQRNEVSVRARGIRRDLGPLVLETFVRTIKEEIETRGRRTVVSEHFQATAV